MTPEHDGFQRGFVAAAYLIGRRGKGLLDGLPEPSARTKSLASQLAHPERQSRAAALAPELAALIRSLDSRRLV
ncbi:MAG: hypothetical protein H6718_08870 [Polyangiaceae bacterium]|nr:hypothetical protein [Polyangiaceae bacterium]MCB9606487.1 hypothetical protein [Polyangiaceae bacterium]